MPSLYFFISESPSFPFANRVRTGTYFSSDCGGNQLCFLTKNVIEGI